MKKHISILVTLLEDRCQNYLSFQRKVVLSEKTVDKCQDWQMFSRSNRENLDSRSRTVSADSLYQLRKLGRKPLRKLLYLPTPQLYGTSKSSKSHMDSTHAETPHRTTRTPIKNPVLHIIN